MHKYVIEKEEKKDRSRRELAKEVWRQRMGEVRVHPETKVIVRGDLPEPWMYVEHMFPEIGEEISKTIIYKNENTAFLQKIGIPIEAGGVFVRPASAIIVGYSERSTPTDIVIVHELLHYASKLMGGNFASFEAEENFAFSNSIKYMDLRGMPRKDICEEYMLPYYWSLMIARVVREQGRTAEGNPTQGELDRAKEMAVSECQLMIRQALDKDAFDDPPEDEPDRFDMV